MAVGILSASVDLASIFAPRGSAARANTGIVSVATDIAQTFETIGTSPARAQNIGILSGASDLRLLFMDINWKTPTPTPTPTPTATPTPTPTTMMYQFNVNGGGLGFSSGTGTGLYVAGATVTVSMTYSAGYEHDYLSTTPSWANSFLDKPDAQTWRYQGTMPAATQSVTPVGKLRPAPTATPTPTPTPEPTATPTPTPTPAPACHNQNLYYDSLGFIDALWTDCGAGANSFADFPGSGWENVFYNTVCITDGTLVMNYGASSQGLAC